MHRDYQYYDDLLEQFGSSLYLLDIGAVRRNAAAFEQAFRERIPGTRFGYSYKTNYAPPICSLVKERGWMAEVVSAMEYDFAIAYGNAADNILVNGPIKSDAELARYLTEGSSVHLDSMEEVDAVVALAEQGVDLRGRLGLRCNITCGDAISRFGIDVADGQVHEAVRKLMGTPGIDLRGIHCHFPHRDLESFRIRAGEMADLLLSLDEPRISYVDMGGGFFGNVSPELARQFSAEVPSYSDYAQMIAEVFADRGVPETIELLLEPGTAIVADVMQFVSRIENVKTVRGKPFATVGGSRFNLGNFGSKLNLPLSILSECRCERAEFRNLDIVGYTCIESDVLYYGYDGPLGVGDIAVFDNAGSYSLVFKPPFIRPNVPVVVCDSDAPERPPAISKRRETSEDILSTFELGAA